MLLVGVAMSFCDSCRLDRGMMGRTSRLCFSMTSWPLSCFVMLTHDLRGSAAFPATHTTNAILSTHRTAWPCARIPIEGTHGMLESVPQPLLGPTPLATAPELRSYSKRQQLLQELLNDGELLLKNRLEVRHLMTGAIRWSFLPRWP